MNEDIKFMSINVAVVTISDTRTLENDKSGEVLEKRIKQAGHIVLAREIVQDEFKKMLEMNKFKNVNYVNLMGGIVSIHTAWKI